MMMQKALADKRQNDLNPALTKKLAQLTLNQPQKACFVELPIIGVSTMK
jgi:hypothetical protein